MRKAILLACVLALGAFAQPPMRHPMAAGQPPTPPTAEIKTYLGLTDAQLTSLQSIQQQERTAVHSIMSQLETKQQALETLLESGSADAASVGQTMLDIQSLRTSIKQTRATYQPQALAVLNADQKAKLATLQTAASLQPAIHEGEFLNLITPPTGSGSGFGFGPMMERGGPGGPGPGGMGMMARRHRAQQSRQQSQ